jgi:glycosyltransferase involved in cell wall biosynthesis
VGESLKRVLILSYYFPPDGGPGTQRAAKFCKYLPEFGWSPVVVTRPANRERGIWETEDRSLEQDIDSTIVIRVGPAEEVPDWAARLPNIDIARKWLAPAWDAVVQAIRDYDPQVMLVTTSPFDLAFIGLRAMDEFGIPVVLDLRDPWALDGWRGRSSRQAWRADFDAMKESLKAGTAVVANTREARAAMLAHIQGLEPSRVHVIPNGYDADDFSGPLEQPMPDDPESFVLVHAGTLHSRLSSRFRGPLGLLRRMKQFRAEPIEPSGRTIEYLVEATKRLRARGHPLMDVLKVVQAGGVDTETRLCVERAQFDDRFHFTGYLAHGQSVALVRSATALFLPLHGLPEGHRSRIVPGKTYEYLASGVPILGCLPEGDARDLIGRFDFGYLAWPTDVESIESALVQLYSDWKQGRFVEAKPPDWVLDYDRKRLTGDLATLLDSVASK